jgi:hypothetical protein
VRDGIVAIFSSQLSLQRNSDVCVEPIGSRYC